MGEVRTEVAMQVDRRLVDIRIGDHARSTTRDERGTGKLKCVICSGALADHEIGDHATRVVERMLQIGFPTPVGRRTH
jgi:hypothetical protein